MMRKCRHSTCYILTYWLISVSHHAHMNTVTVYTGVVFTMLTYLACKQASILLLSHKHKVELRLIGISLIF